MRIKGLRIEEDSDDGSILIIEMIKIEVGGR